LSENLSRCGFNSGTVLFFGVDPDEIHEGPEHADYSRDLRELYDLFLTSRSMSEDWYIEGLYLHRVVVRHGGKGWYINHHIVDADMCLLGDLFSYLVSHALLRSHV